MRMIFLILFVLYPASSSYSQTSFAILPFSVASNVNVNGGPAFESTLYQELINSGRYRIVDRKQIEQVIKEQNFQLTDLADQKKMVAVGKLFGAEKLISGNLFIKSQTQPAVSFSVIDMSTGEIEFSKEESDNNFSWEDMARFTSVDIIEKYPLIGSVLGKAGDIYVIDLGSNNGLKNTGRIFVARKTQLRGEKGEILMEEFNRIGILEIIKTDKTKSQCKIRSTEPGMSIQKDDLISPEPIPDKPVEVSTVPLLPGVKAGSIILDDTMDKKYLSLSNAAGETYKSGRLYFDGRELTVGHVYGYYPPPFDKLSDYIIEGEVSFEKIKMTYNRFALVFRSDGKYPQTGYSFFFNNKGKYEVEIYRKGSFSTLIPLTSTPLLNREDSKNSFKIVVMGPLMDFYLNGQFLIGIKHELYEKGSIGFAIGYGSYLSIDNIKISEVKN